MIVFQYNAQLFLIHRLVVPLSSPFFDSSLCRSRNLMTLSFEINFLGLMYGYVAMDYVETWLYLPIFFWLRPLRKQCTTVQHSKQLYTTLGRFTLVKVIGLSFFLLYKLYLRCFTIYYQFQVKEYDRSYSRSPSRSSYHSRSRSPSLSHSYSSRSRRFFFFFPLQKI